MQQSRICQLLQFYSLMQFSLEQKKVSIRKTKIGNKNQKPFEGIMIMEYELIGIGKVKMTVGIRRRTREKVQYCITAISGV